MSYYMQLRTIKLPKISNSKLNKHYLKKPMANYYLNKLKLLRNGKVNSDYKQNKTSNETNKKEESIVLNITSRKLVNLSKDSSKKEIRKEPNNNPPFSFKYFFNNSYKNKMQKSFSAINVNTIKENKNLESNFFKLKNDSNIYTSNANYIKNKKIVIVDKYIYDNNKYKPDRLGLFDMSDFRHPKRQMGKGLLGHIYYNHNKYRKDINQDS